MALRQSHCPNPCDCLLLEEQAVDAGLNTTAGMQAPEYSLDQHDLLRELPSSEATRENDPGPSVVASAVKGSGGTRSQKYCRDFVAVSMCSLQPGISMAQSPHLPLPPTPSRVSGSVAVTVHMPFIVHAGSQAMEYVLPRATAELQGSASCADTTEARLAGC
ncbi:hypothetical protein mRhiFer1_008787 [Rhinolophus ferrumequinum]|uniref:Uncharacterized protein n=1 Tax=Rhinolophus ferrumequinum TaxID=59479 RepID=A0A7J7TMA8_RHIFE|nr:hypothetical protein mRhiFer1_008787 [Rhinolophus ferrumequinum]